MLFGFCYMLTAGAQTSPAAKARVAEIRKLYAQAKEVIAYKKEAELPPDEMVITNDYMAAGTGPIKETYRFYYSGGFNEDVGRDTYEPYFITRKYNVGAREFYEEILYDNQGIMVFVFKKSGDSEMRYYFDKGALLHPIVKGEKTWEDDPNFLQRYASELVQSFNLLMNREY